MIDPSTTGRTPVDVQAMQPAFPQAIDLLENVYGPNEQLKGISHFDAQQLMMRANTLDLQITAQSEFSKIKRYNDGKWMAAMIVNGLSAGQVASNMHVNEITVYHRLESLIFRLRLFLGSTVLQSELVDFLSHPPEYRTAEEQLHDPALKNTWPYAVLAVGDSEPVPLAVPSVSERSSIVELRPIPTEWAEKRPDQAVPQYVKILRKDTTMIEHPDFPEGIFLTDTDIAILNTLISVKPGEYISSEQLTTFVQNCPGPRIHDAIDGISFLRSQHIIVARPPSESETQQSSAWAINPAIVFMDKRLEVTAQNEYASEFDRIIAGLHDDYRYQGYFFIPDDSVLGLGEELTTELNYIFDESGLVRQHENDVPRTRKRADDIVYGERVSAEQLNSMPLPDMPNWHFEINEHEVIVFVEAAENTVDNPSDTIKERPENYSRFMASDYPALRRFATIAYLLQPPEERSKRFRIGMHCFRTDGVVVETPHQDGVNMGLIRPSKIIGEGAYSQFIRRRHELNPRSKFATRPFASIKVPVGGLVGFNDQRVKHTATHLYDPSDA